jgi:hypothetical protein
MTELVLQTGERASARSRRLLWAKGSAGLLGLLLLGATVAPVAQNWQPEPKDSFPFSFYPMFSQKRGEIYRVHYMVGLDGQGNRHLIPHTFFGDGGFNQDRRQINRLVRKDKADTLCRAVAREVAQDTLPPYTRIEQVRIVTGAFRFSDYFGGNKAPLGERVRASCRITPSDRAAAAQHEPSSGTEPSGSEPSGSEPS